jgi:aspartate aminotransferase-like enzyme
MRGKGLVVAGGQGQWAGRILRFGHMGVVGIDEMCDAVRIMGETLREHGREADASAAVRAMREVFEARQPAAVG